MTFNTSLRGGGASANRQLIDVLLRSRLFRDYESFFTKATGLPLTLRPLDYWQLAHRGKKQENPFCALLSKQPATLAVCLQAHQDMIRHTGVLPHSVTCPFGLTETAVPVKLGGKTIGYLRIGQVLRRTLEKSDTARAARVLSQHGLPFTGEVRDAWEANVSIPPARYDAIVGLLTFFADQLAVLTNQILLETGKAEPLMVRKARTYIANHKGKSLSLSEVAKASGTSPSHFCRVFKRTTGLTFTDHVARVRVEDAKAELLNSDRRISEIAYDVGFQSLTQFNRVFQRIFGQSPTRFRANLTSGKRAVNSVVTRTMLSAVCSLLAFPWENVA